jgi:hypothetical protein
MSCCCNRTPCTCTSVPCADPGLETTGKHLLVLDSQFCTKRLANTNGFLYYGQNGLRFSDSPRVPLAELEVDEDDPFGNLVICSGSNGIWRRVVPKLGVDGFLKANGDGTVSFSDPTAASIPDPLTLNTINVSTLNATDVNVSGTPTFTGLQTDTIVSILGINGSNQLVLGSQQTISVALFYETNDPAGPGTPNWTFPANATANVQIGNEISDADGIASVQDSATIRIDKPGSYVIEWYGQYSSGSPDGGNSAGQSFRPGLWLTINGVIVSKGNIETYQDRNVSGTALGKYDAVSLNAGDLIRLRGNGSMRPSNSSGRGTGLQGVTLSLTKYK